MPNRPAALLRAVKHLSEGAPFDAERAATEGLRADTHHGGLRQVRGVCRHLLHRHRDAIEDLEIAMALVPLDPLGLWCLADSYARTGRCDQSRELLTWLIRRPDCPNSLMARAAKALGRAGEDELALEAFSELARREPRLAEAHFGIAQMRSRLGFPSEAVLPSLYRACELAPANAGYLASLGEAHATLGFSQAARDSVRDVRLDAVDCPHVATKIARSLEISGEFARASAWWIRAVRLAGGGQA